MPPSFQHIDNSQSSQFFSKFKYLLIDCDGVLWLGSNLIESDKLIKLLNTLHQTHEIVFVTNNSTKSRRMYMQKFQQVGLDWVTEEHLLPSCFLAARYLQQEGIKHVYMIGEEGLREELENHGVETILPTDSIITMDESDVKNYSQQDLDRVQCVVVGWDRKFTFRKLSSATLHIQHKKPTDESTRFVATNMDSYDRVSENRNIPGCGAIVGSIISATHCNPTVLGKPNTYVVDYLEKTRSWDRKHMLMIGDRLDSDILLGKNAGIKTLLVLTGVTHEDDLTPESLDKHGICPDYCAQSFPALYHENLTQ